MSTNRIYVDGNGNQLDLILPSSENMVVVSEYLPPRTIEVGIVGLQGTVGPAGTGSVTITEPFTAIVSGRLYSTTASLAIWSHISSSFLPQTGSGGILSTFSLGSSTAAWKSLFLGSQSAITFMDNNHNVMVSMSAGLGNIQIGSTVISTSSFGFSGIEIIKNRGTYTEVSVTGSMEIQSDGSRKPISVNSASREYFSVKANGLMVLGEYLYTPTPITGGIFYSASQVYLGLE